MDFEIRKYAKRLSVHILDTINQSDF